jgi:hypothetical protein
MSVDELIASGRYSPPRTWTYKEIRPHLMTGDQVLFKGSGFFSNLICLFSGGDKSHIGTIFKNKNIDEIQLIESDYGKNFHGFQLTTFGEKVRTYKGDIYIRFLKCRRTDEWYQLLYNYIVAHRQTSYEKGIGGVVELLGATWKKNKKNENELFCSETSAGIFQKWEFLPIGIPANNFTPEDFDENGRVDDLLKIASVSLGQEISLSRCHRIK